jgi:hypothetical protein
MKLWLFFFLLFLSLSSVAQPNRANWSSIDAAVQGIWATTPDSLAYRLSAPYFAEGDKVRAIYSWITQNVSYNAGFYNASKRSKPAADPTDTMTIWKSGDEMTAIRVMHRKMTVCEGYAKLFKVLCDYAGIESRVIYGYVRTNVGSRRFRTNHTWNAVRIDSSWHLLDATWAAGYFNYRDEFIQERNDDYFLTPPKTFIADHYPEDLRWALLPDIPVYRELHKEPFLFKSFDKYRLQSISAQAGVIEIWANDTVQLVWQTKDAMRDKTIAPSALLDSTMLVETPQAIFAEPLVDGNRLVYSFVPAPQVYWVYLMYNGDVLMRYRLNQKQPTGITRILAPE